MRSAEGREEIVKGSLVREVYNRKANRRPWALGVEEVIGPNTEREDMARLGSWRVVVVVLGARCEDIDASRPILRRVATRDAVNE